TSCAETSKLTNG
ncbi:hypothetical protein D043_1964, partial [Vibrio parahaemolyticus EKP-021]